MMKTMGIMTASVAALLLGAKLVLAGFAPVLPPDFDRKWDEDFAMAYWVAHSRSGEQVDFFTDQGRWAESEDDLQMNGPRADMYERWRARNESGWRRYMEQIREETEFVVVDQQRSTIAYHSLEVLDGRMRLTGRAVCTVTLDVEYARAMEAWYAVPGATASRRLPDELERWSRMDCRRTSGLRAWLSWTGLDRYREPPPERYSGLSYARQAWDRAGIDLAPRELPVP